MSPRVSLAMPVHNGERFISVAVESLLDQTFTDLALIITDNASTDSTEDICRDFARRDSRVSYIRNDRNLGAARNFNLGFHHSEGTYFKWCAHDDFLSPDFIQECVYSLNGNKADVLAYGRQQGIDDDGRHIQWLSGRSLNLQDCTPEQRFKLVYRVQGFDAAMFGLIRRTALQRSSLHESYYGSDIALLAELALLGSFQRLPNITFYNREHRNRSVNITAKKARQEWHAPQFASRPLPEHLSLLRHLILIAAKHNSLVPLHKTLPGLAAWTIRPQQVARYALDVAGFASPTLRANLRNVGRGLLFRKTSKPNKSNEDCGQCR